MAHHFAQPNPYAALPALDGAEEKLRKERRAAPTAGRGGHKKPSAATKKPSTTKQKKAPGTPKTKVTSGAPPPGLGHPTTAVTAAAPPPKAAPATSPRASGAPQATSAAAGTHAVVAPGHSAARPESTAPHGAGEALLQGLSLEEQQVLAFVRRHHVDVAMLEGLYTARPAYLKVRARSGAIRHMAGPLRCQLSTMLPASGGDVTTTNSSGGSLTTTRQQCKVSFLRNLSSIEERAEQKRGGPAAVSHDCLVSALVRQNRDETVHGGGVYETNYDCEVDLAVALQGGLGPRLLQQLARAKAVSAGDGQVPAKVWQKLDVGGYTLRYAPGDARRKTYDVLVFEWLEGEVKYSVDFHVVPEGGETYELETLGAQAEARLAELRMHYQAFDRATKACDFHGRIWRYADFVEFCSHQLVEAIWPTGSSRFDCFVV
ncbi:uncharacterized protein ACA1_063290 [Acanthamoeba castellanii str. Neff]|uniref:Uncharacterized protein n=1 Tax=Acanthamoeba castellanii (strain ATCC 30010 / Neff) TaxID=1257118 RepID=L8GX40_ACACF|nr:uncharacterized protein ACA1_063290 [Acanthamoeba castellanii str. Neff]ELR17565.1 hypothetical protein ACA1_063290 [Acanthamoeba castellanii str. Neff]